MKASDLFLRCLEAEGVEVHLRRPRRGERRRDDVAAGLAHRVRDLPARAGRGLHGRPLRPHDRRARRVPRHARARARPTSSPGSPTPTWTHSPVVAITGQGATTRLHKESHQAMDVVAMFKPITKWAATIWDARNLAEVTRKAFKIARAETPGATLIELPEDIAKHDIDDEPIVPGTKVRRPGRRREGGRRRAGPARQGAAPDPAGRQRLRAHPGQQAAAPPGRRDRHVRRDDVHGQGRAVGPPPPEPVLRRARRPGPRDRRLRAVRPGDRGRLRLRRVAPGAVEHRRRPATSSTSTSSPPRSTAPTAPRSRSSATSPTPSGSSTRG